MYVSSTNTYNGSAFTGSTAINTARSNGIGSGSTTAAVIAGGSTPSATANTEVWNGSAWTESSGDLNTARDLLAGSGSSSTNSLAFGGLSTAVTSTESWNGTSWTEVNDLATGRRELGGSSNGSNTLALAFSGCTSPGSVQTATEQWTFPSGPHLNEGDIFLSGDGKIKGFGKPVGTLPSGVWSSANAMNVGREGGGTGFGSQTAGVAVGGNPSPGPDSACEHYNGTTWSNVEAFPSASGQGGTTGTQTAGIAMGLNTPDRALCYTYNGTDWTEVAELNTGRGTGVGLGTQNAALLVGGGPTPGGTYVANT